MTTDQQLEYCYAEINKLNENLEYWRIEQNYSELMNTKYAQFFELFRQNLPFDTCFEVFNDIPKPQNEAEQNAYFDKKASLFNYFNVKHEYKV